MVDFRIGLKMSNIGPHKNLDFNCNVRTNKIAYYAANGVGKTFISRMFGLVEKEQLKTEKNMEYIPQENINVDNLLSLDNGNLATNGNMILKIDGKELNIVLKQGASPEIDNGTGYLFHVFNSEYVKLNVEPLNYEMNGEISGYIVGQEEIDLTKDKEHLIKISEEINNISTYIETEIEKAKEELRKEGVFQTTKEYKNLNWANLQNSECIESGSSFSEIVKKLDFLAKIPEDLPPISVPKFDIDSSVFDDILVLLNTRYPMKNWDQEFIIRLKENQSFFEKGIELSGTGDNCPFCKQKYNQDALLLIKRYKEYLKDKEAEVGRQILKAKSTIHDVIERTDKYNNDVLTACNQLNRIKTYFPSLAFCNLYALDLVAEFKSAIDNILESLEHKAVDISWVPNDVNHQMKKIKFIIRSEIEKSIKNKMLIITINQKKSDTNKERLMLRRKLCMTQFQKYFQNLKPVFKKYYEEKKESEQLQIIIKEKESTVKANKKDEVYKTLNYLFKQFFQGKYSVEQDSFQFKFFDSNIGVKANVVLSDGEKNIVAFCYYLAYSHILLSNENDYKKLFFIIDDPVSSMDFNYVYAIAQVMRDLPIILPNILKDNTHLKMWVFTHNIEFLSILLRNNILDKAFILTKDKISKLNKEILLPYVGHLHDIYCISKNEMEPNHTTGNSIRHVLEVMCHFENPTSKIADYIRKNEVLSSCAYINSFCQDFSHGNIRSEQPISPEDIKTACEKVIEFISTKYEGQIDYIKSIE